MDATKRIIINTLAQYIKSILNIGLSLYSTRLVLKALDIDDYGIFAVVGGVVAMLGFVTNALIVTTQRFISFYHGKGDRLYVRRIFSNSLFLHIIFAIVLAIILIVLKNWLFGTILNIAPVRIEAAIYVYYVTISVLVTTIITAPFKALFIAKENIIYISIIDVFDGILKLLLAFWLLYINSDKLIFYAFMMLGVQLVNFLAFSVYAVTCFDECSAIIRPKDIDKSIQRQLIGFAGWTCYNAGAVVGRNHGTAVVLNHFCGTAINAAYGIAAHVYGAIAFIVTSLLNAMNPQIMKAEGRAERQQALMLAMQQSKFSTAILSIVAIPIICEIPEILNVWLVEVPPYTTMFCVFILIGFVLDQTTLGLNAANQATGNIRAYSLLTYTPKLLYLPAIWIMMNCGWTPIEVMVFYVAIELFVAMIRLPFSKIKLGLSIRTYLRKVLLPLIPLILISSLTSLLCVYVLQFPMRFLLTFVIGGSAGLLTAWFFTLTANERNYVKKLIRRK